MLDAIRTTLRERIERGATLDELDTIVRMSRGLRPEERSELWRFAWSYEPPAVPQPAPPALH
jgi:hypothetical protein